MARSGLRSAVSKKKRKKARRPEIGRVRGPKIEPAELDYKNIPLLQRLTTAQGKLFSRKRSGLDAKGQRTLASAIKRARFMALMPFVT